MGVVDSSHKRMEFLKLDKKSIFVQLELFQDDENRRLRAIKKSSEQKVEAGITGPLPQYVFDWYRINTYTSAIHNTLKHYTHILLGIVRFSIRTLA